MVPVKSNLTSPKIVVLGSINMDVVIRCETLPRPGETVIAKSSDEVCGGKGANQAIAAARLGGKVDMIGSVGSDSFAARLLTNLRDAEICIEAVRLENDCASGLAVVAVEDSGQNAILVVPGANGRVTIETLREHVHRIAHSEVLLCQLELPLETVLRGIEVAKASGVRVILNPAPMPSVFPAALLHVDLICPNQHEAESLLKTSIQSTDDARVASEELVRLGAKHSVITLGGNGAVVCDGDRTQWIKPFVTIPVDTTAAGDAFAGAIAVYWSQLGDLFQAARYASAAGAIAVSRAGAQPSLPTRAELEAFLNSQSHDATH